MKMPKAMERQILEMAGEPIKAPKPKAEIPPSTAGVFRLPVASSHGDGRFGFTIDGWRPVRLNVIHGSHWTVGAARKKSDAMILAAACHVAGVTRAIGTRRLEYTIIMGPGQRREPDSDAYDKSIRDGLVLAGALVDDSNRWLVPTVPKFERSESGPATRIVLTDA